MNIRRRDISEPGAADAGVRHAAAVLERCDVLAGFSEEPGRLTRRFATDALRDAGAAVQGWMHEAGMTTWRDAIARPGSRSPSSAIRRV